MQPQPDTRAWRAALTQRAWVWPQGRQAQFRALGCNNRWRFFEHEVRFLPHAAPDAWQLARAMAGMRDPARLWQIVLHARGDVLEGLPPELFHDDDVVWHQQHFGRPGHIAYASIALDHEDIYGLNYVSDVVQRIGRRREYKTAVGSRFRGWPALLLNSMIAFAVQHRKRRVLSPTADWVLQHTDPSRTVDRDLFDRVYDHAVTRHFRAQRQGRWWIIDVAANRDRIVIPDVETTQHRRDRTICICHDIERDWGHRASQPQFAPRMDATARAALPAMLEAERRAGVRATYHVVGAFLPEVQGEITGAGHALAFHSFDHTRRWRQLPRCRHVDYRVRGYRPPQSRLTRELHERTLCRYNFDWLASSAASLRLEVPQLEQRVVKLPIALDDYPLFTGALDYASWERRALERIAAGSFAALSLHDCYADHWLPHYERFLERVSQLGDVCTLEDVANDVLLAAAC